MTRMEAWKEIAYVTLTPQSGNSYHFCAFSENVDIDEGERGIETVKTLCGGRIVRTIPQDDTKITMKLYPAEAGTSGAATGRAYGVHDLFYESFTNTSTDGKVTANNSPNGARKKYRCAILWTDDNTSTDATRQVVSPTNAALRYVARNGYITKINQTFSTDALLSYEVTITVPARPADGATANIYVESLNGVGTGTMATLSTYSTDTNGF